MAILQIHRSINKGINKQLRTSETSGLDLEPVGLLQELEEIYYKNNFIYNRL